MTTTSFVNGVTLTDDDWFNDVNRLHYTILGDPATLLALQNTVIPARGFISGGTMANGTDAVNDINFGAGFYRDSTNAAFITCSALVKQLDAAWAAGTNAGGRMSAAAIANGTYHCYAIRKDSDGSGDYGFDTSATAPTMPSGYTFFRRIGSIVRAGATILAFTQHGDSFTFGAQTSDDNTSNPGTAARTITVTVPTGIQVQSYLSAYVRQISNASALLVSSLENTDDTPDGVSKFTISNSGVAAATETVGSAPVYVWTNTSGQVRARVNFSDANSIVRLATKGWIDYRGRFD